MYSLIIKNARVIDGTGAAEKIADIAVSEQKIAAVQPHISARAKTVIDAAGKVVAPGFIDVQNHSDSYWQLFDNPNLDSTLTQGFTTVLVGNCGGSLAPLLSPSALLSLQKWHGLDGANINWQSFAEFAAAMKQNNYGCNVLSLVGYSTLRRGLVGDSTDPLTSEELRTLIYSLEQALDQGAFGLSTGLAYAHELNTSEVELYELARTVKKHNALFSVHLRNEGSNIVDSVREVINIAQQAEVNVKISHLKIRDQSNWSKLEEVLAELESAWHRGAKIHFDVYPYTSTWQPLYAYLPSWIVSGGRTSMLEQLHQPEQRNKVLSYLNNVETRLKDFVIASTGASLQSNGKTIGQLATDMGVSSEQAVLTLIENGGSEVLVFDQCISEEVVETLSNHALGFVASDGGGFNLKVKNKLVHPRCFGAAPKFLRQVLDKKKISLPEAIRKLSGGPASMLGLQDRGVIKAHNFADLVMFDDKTIADKATLTNPFQFAKGIEAVWVNGTMLVQHGQPTGAKSGIFLTRNG
jgi:N-acyl-D-amino-acid deacylase